MMTKKNTLTAKVATLIGSKLNIATLELWAETVIENHRFTSRSAQVLSRLGETTSRQVRLGSAEELAAAGHNIVAIAFALDRGVTASAVKKALKGGISLKALVSAIENGLDTGIFSRAVMCGLVVRHFASTVENMQGDELNGALENFIEHKAEVKAEPDPVRRSLAVCGEDDYVVVAPLIVGHDHMRSNGIRFSERTLAVGCLVDARSLGYAERLAHR